VVKGYGQFPKFPYSELIFINLYTHHRKTGNSGTANRFAQLFIVEMGRADSDNSKNICPISVGPIEAEKMASKVMTPK